MYKSGAFKKRAQAYKKGRSVAPYLKQAIRAGIKAHERSGKDGDMGAHNEHITSAAIPSAPSLN
ncbi:MAG: hypothetical protein H7835_20160, partial [Magnetococcus sp. XQGC-1]